MDATVIKRDKRLLVVHGDTGVVIYTPPDFLRSYISSRDALQALANAFNAKGERDINAIITFETETRRPKPPNPFRF